MAWQVTPAIGSVGARPPDTHLRHVSLVAGRGFRVSIARRLGLTRQSVQRVVNELASDGLVVSDANPDHARSSLVSLTQEGRHVMAELFTRSEASRKALLDRADVSSDDLDAARLVLEHLVASFDEVDAGEAAH